MPLSQLRIPRAVQLVIDDGGMREGLRAVGPEDRFGIPLARNLEAEDYRTLARIARRADTCIQLAMILCYWDKANVCARYPTTQWMGADWDNSGVAGSWIDEAAAVFADNPDRLEFVMHGVGHDYWTDGQPHIGEWCDRDSGEPWPYDALQGHIDCFRAILRQTGLRQALAYEAPRSFVPCYFQYCLRDGDSRSTGYLMAQNGVRYASTPFHGGLHTRDGDRPQADGVFDSGVLLLERDNTEVKWNDIATVPPRLPRTSICGMHWGNFLAHDSSGNDEVADRWVEYLEGIDAEPGLMLARSTPHCWSQYVAHRWGRIEANGSMARIDLSGVPEEARRGNYLGCVTVEWPLPAGLHLCEVRGDAFEAAYGEEKHGLARVDLKPRDADGGIVEAVFDVEPARWVVVK